MFLHENEVAVEAENSMLSLMLLSPQCSTTCGVGAIWRTVECSSQIEGDCASMKRPEPARTCHLQPCATWQSGSWSKVSNLRFPEATEPDCYTDHLVIKLSTSLISHLSSLTLPDDGMCLFPLLFSLLTSSL